MKRTMHWTDPKLKDVGGLRMLLLFRSRPFELKKKEEEEEKEEEADEQSAFFQFSDNRCTCIFYVV